MLNRFETSTCFFSLFHVYLLVSVCVYFLWSLFVSHSPPSSYARKCITSNFHCCYARCLYAHLNFKWRMNKLEKNLNLSRSYSLSIYIEDISISRFAYIVCACVELYPSSILTITQLKYATAWNKHTSSIRIKLYVCRLHLINFVYSILLCVLCVFVFAVHNFRCIWVRASEWVSECEIEEEWRMSNSATKITFMFS